MHLRMTRCYWFFLILFIAPAAIGRTEGTKELEPLPGGESNPTKLHLSSYPNSTNVNYNNFALYVAAENERLQITIGDVTPGSAEKIYFGFKPQPVMSGFPPNPNDPQISCRIKRPDGSVIWGPTVLPWQTGNQGYIDTYTAASIGPSVLPGGTGGYNAIVVTPDVVGDYYIEFSFPGTNVTRTFDYFDITVASSAGVKIPGRVWSKAWQFTTDGDQNTSQAVLYPYTDDGITTSIDFNGICPYRFAVSCNATGCNNTGNIETDRKSVAGKFTYPQYRIFLNPPDTNISYFGVGELGVLQSATVDSISCNGTTYLKVFVNKAGWAKLTITLPPPYVNKELSNIPVVPAPTPNLLTWNGIDGAGTSVANGTPFSISVEYINGLTNLPLYDAEYMNYSNYPEWNGYIIELVSPQTIPPLHIQKFWNDTLIKVCGTQCVSTVTCNPPVGGKYEKGGLNETGCNLPAGCHPWDYCIGNENTVNTWWYALSTNAIQLNALVEKRIPSQPGTINGTSTFCSGSEQTYSVAPVANADTYIWTFPAGVTPVGTPPFNSGTITLNFPPSVNGIQVITVAGVNNDCGAGPSRSLTLTINPVPDVAASPASPWTICNGGTATISLTSTITGTVGNTTFNWSGAAANPGNVIPSFPGGSTLTQIVQSFTSTSNNPENVVFTITPTSSGCTGAPVTYTVTVNPTPAVDLTTPGNPLNPQNICSGVTTQPMTLASNVTTPSPSYIWTVACNSLIINNCPPIGTGTVIPPASPVNLTDQPQDIVYTITASIPASAGMTCSGPATDYTVHIYPKPALGNTVFSQDICSGSTSTAVNLIPIPTPPATVSFNWIAIVSTPLLTGYTASGTNTLVIPSQTITNPTTTVQYVDYVIVPVFTGGSSSCQGDAQTYRINIHPVPDVIFTPPSLAICSGNQANVGFTTSIAEPTTFQWSFVLPLPAGIGVVNGSGTGNFQEFITNAGSAPANVQIQVIPTSSSGCTPATPYLYTLTVNPAPTPTVTGTAALCEGTTGVIYSTQVSMTNYAWTVSAGGQITAGGTATSPSVTVTWNNAGAQSVSVTYTNGNGCPAAIAGTLAVTVNPLPVSTFTGSTAVCQLFTAPTLYPANSGPLCSYSWSMNPVLGTIASPSASTASVTWDNPGITNLTLVATTASGCTTNSTRAITVNPRPEVSIQPCFDVVTRQGAKPFLLKGGRPLLTSTPFQGEYLVSPSTPALYSDASGTYYFDPGQASPGVYAISYRYTSGQFGCPATSPTSVSINVMGPVPACGATMTDHRDTPPTVYKTSTIGGKCWMLQNLNYGGSVSNVTTPMTDNCTVEKYCLPAVSSCSSYGGLYQWDELIQYGQTGQPYQGVCPPGWHVPTALEWEALIQAVSGLNPGDGIAASYLMQDPGFHAVVEGMYYQNDTWAFQGWDPSATMFWTSTLSNGKPLARGMNSVNMSVARYESPKVNAFPVRCIKD